MFIKEINITGFRSYKELTTIREISPKHNVVVGRNGSGKSNFFFAIQLVLSNEFNTLDQKMRNSLLHEGTGQRSTVAKVEIVFDNTMRRLLSENDEVRISRQVSVKKDQYFIDNKPATRNDIMNLLESAGISRSNPYYIVKQGKVMEFALQADAQRLKLIREVAGTRVFDERKDESVKLLQDTQSKLDKCQELLRSMDERLQKLEEEKQDLKEYQKYDKMKRAIDYTINELESNEFRKKADKHSRKREELNDRQNEIETEMMAVQQSILNTQSSIKRLESRFKGIKDERDILVAEQTELQSKRSALELMIKDLKEDIEGERDGRDNAEDDLKKLKSEIQQKQEELELLEPQFKKLVEKETKILTDIKINEQQISELNAKLGRKEMFKSVAERDHYLNKEINKTNHQVDDAEKQIHEIEQSIHDDDANTGKLNGLLMKYERELRDKISDIDTLNRNIADKRRTADRLSVDLKDAQVQESLALDELKRIQEDIQSAEGDLFKLAPKGVNHGIKSVQYVFEWMKRNNQNGKYDEVINGYYGMVVDHIDCSPEYFLAVDVTARNRIFYHVVKDDRVAMKILDQVNSRELRGEINFFPLNRLSVKPCRDVTGGDATPLLKLLKYDEKYDAVMRQLFAGTVVVKDLVDGARVSRNERVNCVTTAGDQVNRRGPLTGGYLDRKRSKMEASSKWRDSKKMLVVTEEKAESTAALARDLRQQYEAVMIELHQLEAEAAQLKEQHQVANEKRHNISEQLNRSVMSKEPKNAQIVQLKERVRQMQARKEMLQQQLGSEFESQLTEDEHRQMADLQDQITRWRREQSKISKERIQVENKKNSLEYQLHSNLLRRRDNIQSKIQDISIEDKKYKLNVENTQMKQVNERLSSIMHRINAHNEELSDFDKEHAAYKKELEASLEKKAAFDKQIVEIAKQTDTYCSKIADYQSKRDEFTKKMNEIGMITTDALGKYKNCTPKELDRKLTECMSNLKKYENVNKKAFDQFVRANTQKEGLTTKLEELTKNEQSIKNLIDVLENRRQETLSLTFKQVAKNFSEVFAQLIPGGTAELIMKYNDNASPESQGFDVNAYSGIGIKVSFSGSGETKEMAHLSGGQKTLVALTLIFAIQKCDPAPFYLFDEVDAALDRQYRQSVAQMIHELSENAQFITTTFRPELLEHAEKFYGVRFRNKVSYIDPTSRTQAYDFVTDDQNYN